MGITKKMELDETAAANLDGLLVDVCGAGTLEDAQELAAAAIHLLSEELKPARMTAIQTGVGQEVPVEVLLMKIALAEQVMAGLVGHIALLDANDGDIGNLTAPGQWAIAGAFQSLGEASHALKCACWGYQAAFTH